MKINLELSNQQAAIIFYQKLKDFLINEMGRYFYKEWLPKRQSKKKYKKYNYESYFIKNKYMLLDMLNDYIDKHSWAFYHNYEYPRKKYYKTMFDDWAKLIPDAFIKNS